MSTYKLKLFPCVFVCMRGAFSTSDALWYLPINMSSVNRLFQQKEDTCLIHFIVAAILQSYRYSYFLVKVCFARLPGLICCTRSIAKVTHNCYTWLFSKYFCRFFIWICVACWLKSDKLVPFLYFTNCSAHTYKATAFYLNIGKSQIPAKKRGYRSLEINMVV